MFIERFPGHFPLVARTIVAACHRRTIVVNTNIGYTKLRLWGLTQYKRVVYIDADALVMGSLDEVTVLHIDVMDYSSLHRSAYLYVV